MVEFGYTSSFWRKPSPKLGPRVITTESWRWVPAGLRGHFKRHDGEYVWILLDRPFPMVNGKHPTRSVKMHLSCVRELRPLELLAECAG